MTFYTPDTSNIYQYINDSFEVSISQPETISWSIPNQFWSSFKAYCPEMYCFCDAQHFGVSEVQFRAGVAWFSNLSTTTTYNTFFGSETDQTVTVVCNENPQLEKRFMSIEVNSKSNLISIRSIAYEGYTILTSDWQNSRIPLLAFQFKESRFFSVFYRDLSLGKTLQTGDGLRGNFLKITLVRDTSQRTVYNELSKIVITFITSEKSI